MQVLYYSIDNLGGLIISYKETDKKKDAVKHLLACLRKGIGQSHHPVNDNQLDFETDAECEHLLTDSVSKGSRTIRFFTHDFRHRSVGDNVPRMLDRLEVHISEDRWIYV
jgi:hypothetical protein